jgi:hypothetical protein
MARYTRMEITALSERLEARANSIANPQPNHAGDLRAAAMLLRLMLALADVQVVETGPVGSLDGGQRPN